MNLVVDMIPIGIIYIGDINCYYVEITMRRLSKYLIATLLAGIAFGSHSAQADENSIPSGNSIQNIPATNLDWEVTPEGVAFAPLIGNRFAEAYMAMVRLPAGLASPPHVKSANMFGVMLSGAMTHVAIGADVNEAVILSSGSFYKIPKGIPHISSCVSNVECVTFLYQDGKFDFLAVQK